MTENLSPSDYFGLASSIASGVLAVVALALSIVFFILSKRDAERSTKNAQEISGSVTRLEKLFDTLYSDTFSMMRDTYTDMRKHVWRATPADSTADEAETGDSSVAEQTRELLHRVGEASQQIGVTGEKLAELQERLQPVVRQTLEAESERREESPSLRTRIVRFVQSRDRRGIPATVGLISRALNVEEGGVVDEVFDLGRQGVLDWDGAANLLANDTAITYVPSKERADLLERRRRFETGE